MTNVHRRLLSSSSFSLAAGEARSLPRPRLEDVSREAHAPNPAAALLSLAAARGSHVRAPSPGRGHSRQGSSDDDESLLPPAPFNDDEGLQQAINIIFEEAGQEAGQRERESGGRRMAR
jgi:hypothetical protein